MESNFWKISDFVNEINKVSDTNLHVNTVDNWFKKLEEMKMHYISRTEETGEKVYTAEDLQIALHIQKFRKQNWQLKAIFATLETIFELRPFPGEENGSTSGAQVLDIEGLKSSLIVEFEKIFESKIQTLESKIMDQQKYIEESSTSKQEIESIFKSEIQKLEQRLVDQQEYIEKSLDQRDRALVDHMRQSIEQQKMLAAAIEKEDQDSKDKKWWKFWKS